MRKQFVAVMFLLFLNACGGGNASPSVENGISNSLNFNGSYFIRNDNCSYQFPPSFKIYQNGMSFLMILTADGDAAKAGDRFSGSILDDKGYYTAYFSQYCRGFLLDSKEKLDLVKGITIFGSAQSGDFYINCDDSKSADGVCDLIFQRQSF